MSDICDVLYASNGSAADMTRAFRDYGDGSMECGIKKFTASIYNGGYINGAEEMYPVAYSEGKLNGFVSGTEETYPIAYSDGKKNGLVTGTIITVAVSATVGLTIWGVKTLVDRHNRKKAQKELKIAESSKLDDQENLAD